VAPAQECGEAGNRRPQGTPAILPAVVGLAGNAHQLRHFTLGKAEVHPDFPEARPLHSGAMLPSRTVWGDASSECHKAMNFA